MRELPKAHEIWRHFKKNTYEIITIAEHTETGEKFVIYKALHDTMKTYARPLMFFKKGIKKSHGLPPNIYNTLMIIASLMDIIRQTLNLSSGRYTYYKAFHAMPLVPRKASFTKF